MPKTITRDSGDAPSVVRGRPAPEDAGSSVEQVDLVGLRKRVHTAVHGDVKAVSMLLMAWSGKRVDLVQENGRALIRCPVPGHEDRNPSCVVFRSKKSERVHFRCRGCGSIGDLVTAHQLIFHTDVERAMLAVAGAFGILLEPDEAPQHRDTVVDAVIDAASKVYRVPVDKITSASRSRPLVDARQAAMYVTRQTSDLSYPEIARAFGGRDHTTVLHAVRKIEQLMGERDDVRKRVLSVQALVDGRPRRGRHDDPGR